MFVKWSSKEGAATRIIYAGYIRGLVDSLDKGGLREFRDCVAIRYSA